MKRCLNTMPFRCSQSLFQLFQAHVDQQYLTSVSSSSRTQHPCRWLLRLVDWVNVQTYGVLCADQHCQFSKFFEGLYQFKSIRASAYLAMEGHRISINPAALKLLEENQGQRQQNLSLNGQLRYEGDLHMPTNICGFQSMAMKCQIFVDKSLFIRDLLIQTITIMIITRPRRWGKSLLLSMVYLFFNMEVDQNGIPKEEQSKRVFFTGGEIIQRDETLHLKRLKICQEEGGKYLKKQGQYPVIMMSLNDLSGNTFQEFFKLIKERIAEVFNKKQYILRFLRQKQRKGDADKFERLQNKTADEGQLIASLKFLTQLLREFHNKLAIILIDQYDNAFNNMIQRGCSKEEREKVSNFMTKLLGQSFKGNDNLEIGIATGIFDTLQKQGNSGLNNISICGVMDDNFSKYYGFTKDEIEYQLVDQIFKEKDSKNENQKKQKHKIMKNIEQWYNGYMNPKKIMATKCYNPYSVIRYLSALIISKQILTPQSYWTKSGVQKYLTKIFSSACQHKIFGKMLSLPQLYKKNKIKLRYNGRVSLGDFDYQTNSQEKYISYILANSGYMTGAIIGDQLHAELPNLEVYYYFKEELKNWAMIQRQRKILSRKSTDLTNPKEVDQLFCYIYQMLRGNIGIPNEFTFNGLFCFGYMLLDGQKYIISTELYTGPNYVDHIYYPKMIDRELIADTVIIHEFKYCESCLKQIKMCQDALWQIFQKDYMNHPLAESITQPQIKNIIVRGIVILPETSSKKFSLLFSTDQKYSIEEASIISLFFKKNVKDKQLLSEVRDVFFAELEKCKTKDASERLLYSILVKDYIKAIEHNQSEKKMLNHLQNAMQKLRNGSKRPLKPQYPLISQHFNRETVGSRLPVIGRWWKKKTINLEALTERFKKRFPTGESLFDSTLEQITEVCGLTEQGELKSRQIHAAIQAMKEDPTCFGPERLDDER